MKLHFLTDLEIKVMVKSYFGRMALKIDTNQSRSQYEVILFHR